MIEGHRARLRALSDGHLETVARVTGTEGEALLIEALEDRGWCQADIVMALLHSPDPDARRVLCRRA